MFFLISWISHYLLLFDCQRRAVFTIFGVEINPVQRWSFVIHAACSDIAWTQFLYVGQLRTVDILLYEIFIHANHRLKDVFPFRWLRRNGADRKIFLHSDCQHKKNLLSHVFFNLILQCCKSTACRLTGNENSYYIYGKSYTRKWDIVYFACIFVHSIAQHHFFELFRCELRQIQTVKSLLRRTYACRIIWRRRSDGFPYIFLRPCNFMNRKLFADLTLFYSLFYLLL